MFYKIHISRTLSLSLPHIHQGLGSSAVKFVLQRQEGCVCYRRSSSLGWFLLSMLLVMSSESSCLRMSVMNSSLLCSAVMMSDATQPRSRMEKERCSSNVWINDSTNVLLFTSWPSCFRAFSTRCCPQPATSDTNTHITGDTHKHFGNVYTHFTQRSCFV